MNSIKAAHAITDSFKDAQLRSLSPASAFASSPVMFMASAAATASQVSASPAATAQQPDAIVGAGLTALGALITTTPNSNGSLAEVAVLSDGTFIAGGMPFDNKVQLGHFSAEGEFLNSASVDTPPATPATRSRRFTAGDLRC